MTDYANSFLNLYIPTYEQTNSFIEQGGIKNNTINYCDFSDEHIISIIRTLNQNKQFEELRDFSIKSIFLAVSHRETSNSELINCLEELNVNLLKLILDKKWSQLSAEESETILLAFHNKHFIIKYLDEIKSLFSLTDNLRKKMAVLMILLSCVKYEGVIETLKELFTFLDLEGLELDERTIKRYNSCLSFLQKIGIVPI